VPGAGGGPFPTVAIIIHVVCSVAVDGLLLLFALKDVAGALIKPSNAKKHCKKL